MSAPIIDELTLAFELEITAANTRCPNCGKVRLTVTEHPDFMIRDADGKTMFTAKTECLRCEAYCVTPFTFEKDAKFAY